VALDQDEADSTETIADLEADRSFRIFLPVLVLLFTPITVIFAEVFGPAVSIFFLFLRLDFNSPFIGLSFVYEAAFLMISLPAIIMTIYSSFELRRLSQKKTTAESVLRRIAGATVVWAFYLSIYLFGSLSIGRPFFPVPVPFGPLVAVLSRGYIMDVTEKIDGSGTASLQ